MTESQWKYAQVQLYIGSRNGGADPSAVAVLQREYQDQMVESTFTGSHAFEVFDWLSRAGWEPQIEVLRRTEAPDETRLLEECRDALSGFSMPPHQLTVVCDVIVRRSRSDDAQES